MQRNPRNPRKPWIILIYLFLLLLATILAGWVMNTNRQIIRAQDLQIQQLKEELQEVNQELQNFNQELQNLNRELQAVIEELGKWEIFDLEVTAYAPFDNQSGICNDGNPNSTATGTRPDWGTVAVNPAVFPYGTEFYIPGYGYGVAEDTGSMVRARNDLIDVYMDSYAEAIAWGRVRLPVFVRKGGGK